MFDNQSFASGGPQRAAADVGFQDRARQRLIELLEADDQKPFRDEVEREQRKIERGITPRTIDDITPAIYPTYNFSTPASRRTARRSAPTSRRPSSRSRPATRPD